ncbi:ATP-binding cassette domain-containing protein [Arthrobacter sp. SD76]|uniref:ATP-binding cassette domain-containing protein n=1 Tax=Arthrobacter sp. SD76 TaxID=3415007 RepID=UPI003C70C604
MQRGVLLVPGNRLRDGVWAAGTAEENLTVPVLEDFQNWKGLDARKIRTLATRLMQRARVHPAEPEFPVTDFSGGNQQKLVFMKWLQLNPQVLLLDEPTQGVDPGAAKLLLEEMVEAAKAGAAVAMFSGDHEQLVATCHRVLVLHQGRIVAELAGKLSPKPRYSKRVTDQSPCEAASRRPLTPARSDS